jgi:hypothetical protein
MNTPDRWVVLKIDFEGKTIYKVFGVWYGGYLGGNYWQLNSGIASLEVTDDSVLFHGNSGSQYLCYLPFYGLGGWGMSQLKSLMKKFETDGSKVEVLPHTTDWSTLV